MAPEAAGSPNSVQYEWDSGRQRAMPVAIPCPPVEPEVIRTTKFVPVANHSFERAQNWAMANMPNRRMTPAEFEETLKSLRDQYLAATA